MPQLPSPKNTASLLFHLNRSNFKHQAVSGTELDPQMVLLQTWQTKRLSHTHADLRENPRYKPAITFFLEDIYAPQDFSQRDHDMEHIYHFMRKFLPEKLIHPLTLTIALYRQTEALDNALLSALVNELHITDSISAEQYAEAYRICDNYQARLEQIERTVEVGQSIDKLVDFPLTGTTLRLARRPAHKAGWFELQDFLERGYAAFKHMRGAKEFLQTIQHREKDILDKIFAGDPRPFGDFEFKPVQDRETKR